MPRLKGGHSMPGPVGYITELTIAAVGGTLSPVKAEFPNTARMYCRTGEKEHVFRLVRRPVDRYLCTEDGYAIHPANLLIWYEISDDYNGNAVVRLPQSVGG